LAGDAIAAMYFDQPSVHCDVTGPESTQDEEDHYRADWRQAVRAAVQGIGTDRPTFLVALATLKVFLQETFLQDMAADNEQFDRVINRIGERIKSSQAEAEIRDHHRRLVRSMCAAIARDCEDDSQPEALSFAGMSAGWVIPAIGPLWMNDPEGLWLLLESKGNEFLAYEAMREAGPAAAPVFLDYLLQQFRDAQGKGYFNEAETLAEVGRGNREVVGMMLESLAAWESDALYPAAVTLHCMGADARVHEDAIHALLRLLDADEPKRRAAAAYALGSVAKGVEEAVPALLKLTYDNHAEEDDGGGQLVAGSAMTALSEIGLRADLVVPRLCEMFETYKEYDCDMEYGGEHARVCDALMVFGLDALPVLPILLKLLKEMANQDPSNWGHFPDLLKLLSSFGTLASEALPLLEELEMKQQAYYDRRDNEEGWDDNDDDEDDEVEAGEAYEEDPSEFCLAIRRIRG